MNIEDLMFGHAKPVRNDLAYQTPVVNMRIRRVISTFWMALAFFQRSAARTIVNSAFILQIAAKMMVKVIMEPSPRNRVGSYGDVTTSPYAHHLSHFWVASP
jgi:hypothetical protein